MSFRLKGRPVVLATVLVGGLGLVAPVASAHPYGGPHGGLAVQQVNLVSDQPGKAALADPDLVNPWGLALGATSPLWSSNAGTSTSTLYTAVPTKVPTVRVNVPAPTGQVANAGTGFVLTNGTTSAPARFIFSTLTGQIAAWGPPVTPLVGAAEIKATTPGAVYTGLALATTDTGDRLYAANFAQHRIDVFDSTFAPVKQSWWAFRDFAVPSSYSPFNVQTLGGRIFVSYAKVDKLTGRNATGHGLGYVDEFTVDGKFVARVASRGDLNAPWGLALAPTAWGQPAGTLLIGNFGDGRINLVQPKSHNRYKSTGQVRTPEGKPLTIDGLWALTQATATTGGADALWFSAGPDNETHGLIGLLRKP